MTIATGNFAELLWPGINAIWGHTYNQYPKLYTKIFTVKKSDKRFEKEQGVTSLPLVGVKNEGDTAEYTDPFQGYQKEYVNVTYGLGSSVTREMYEDDQYGYINEIPRLLAQSLAQSEETVAFNHLNRGFNASFTGADGVRLFDNSHPLVAGGTFRNQLSTPSDLTQTSLETAIQDMMDFVDDQSLKIRVLPKSLVVPTALNFTARKLLESGYVVGSADNDVNPVMGLFQDLVVSPWLTDPDAWFIITDVSNGLVWYDRRPAQLERDNEFDTQNLKFLQTKRWSSGWTNPRTSFASAGA